MNDEIFISYAREDRARVEPLARFLEAAGWSVWWDREIPIGRTFDEVIEEALDAAQCVIVVWTETSVASRWVKTEAEEGLHRQILTPVLMDEVRIPLAFRRVQAADLVGWEGEPQHPGIARLLTAVTHFAGPPGGASLAPEREDAPEAGHDEAVPEEIASIVVPQAISSLEDVEPVAAEEPKAAVAFEAEEATVVEAEGPEAGDAGASGGEAVEEAIREDLEEQPPETLPEEEADTSEKPVLAGLARWIKEPRRRALVAVGVIAIALVLVVELQKDDPPHPQTPEIASIEIDPPGATIAVDSTVHLAATLRDSLDNPLDGPVRWESSNTSVASVSQTGAVAGLREGSATITASSEGAQGTARVSVALAPSPATPSQGVAKIAFASIPGRSWSMGTYEVTQGQWKAVMGTEPWKGKPNVREGDTYPAVYVSWDDAQAFIAKLNELDSRYRYRLPTSDEWEYACRAGSTTAYSFGDDESQLGDYAWYSANAWDAGEQYAHPVGQKRANGWDLYDMHGNVWEWTETQSDSNRVFRGGSFSYTARYARSANHYSSAPDYHDFALGFRLLRTGL